MRYCWGDLISLEYGKPVADKDNSFGSVPVYGTNGCIGVSDLPPLCPYPSFIIGRKGAYRGVHFSDHPFSVIDTAFYVAPKSKLVNLKWAYYKFLTYDINRMDSGSAIPSTDRYEIYQIPVEVPKPESQQKIVAILDAINNKIELNAQINRNLEEQARAIFKSWFIDFEPFRDGEFVDSELGPIPKGWSRGVLADIVDFCKQRIRVSELSPTTYISTENMLPNGGGIVDASSLPSVEYVTAFQKNDVLVSNIRPYFKKIWYCAFSGGCSNDVLCFSAKKTIPSEYIYSILNDEIFFAYVTAGAKGTKMPRGDKSQIMAYPVILPADSALKKFSELVRPMIVRKRINEEESQYLSQLRDTLLPKLMSGEIDVSAVEV